VHAFKLDEFDNCENLYDDLKHDHVREINLTFFSNPQKCQKMDLPRRDLSS
jgi:hypothetical protein